MEIFGTRKSVESLWNPKCDLLLELMKKKRFSDSRRGFRAPVVQNPEHVRLTEVKVYINTTFKRRY